PTGRPAHIPGATPRPLRYGPNLTRRSAMRRGSIVGRRPARQAIARGRSRRPVLEPLERRAVPASYTVASVTALKDAMNAANQTIEADTITLAAGATFMLTAVDNTTDGATGLPVIAATGGNLTIVGNGDVIERSTAKGTPAFRLLDVALGAALTLESVTLQGGRSEGAWGDPGPGGRGGAIYSKGSLTLNGVTVRNNIARGFDATGHFSVGGSALGGGVFSGGSLVVTGSTIGNNAALGG